MSRSTAVFRNVTGTARCEEDPYRCLTRWRTVGPALVTTARLSDNRTALGPRRVAPQLSQLDAHLRPPSHVLHADPLVRPMNVLHPGKQIGRRQSHLGQTGPVRTAPRRSGPRLEPHPAARLARQLHRPHV